ncbi:hypothetical protein AMTR_s00054p00204860 [Amborella trichopoda]|uniref:Uncharacterized protein n=1 Tax=Amborella trichopoda TaxID=13333 RepID=U5D9U7_AMBTC|nr:hypothetical protein AMTR_s00054p00204860 [Amborella trichopoda]
MQRKRSSRQLNSCGISDCSFGLHDIIVVDEILQLKKDGEEVFSFFESLCHICVSLCCLSHDRCVVHWYSVYKKLQKNNHLFDAA